MKAHKYWSVGALITMLGTFYTGYKKQKASHKYFALSLSLIHIQMCIRDRLTEDERKQIIGVIKIDTIAEKSDLGYMAMIEGNKRPDDICLLYTSRCV